MSIMFCDDYLEIILFVGVQKNMVPASVISDVKGRLVQIPVLVKNGGFYR